jgi:hypothetical protein
MKIKKTYFQLLYQQQKVLLGFVIFFIVGQVFFSFKGVETTPCFNYGMYSTPIESRSIYTKNVLLENGAPLSLEERVFFPKRFLTYQLDYYQHLLQRDTTDPVIYTIQKRFGQQSPLTLYLTPFLSNNTTDLQNFIPWMEAYMNTKKLSIRQQSYQLKAQFERYDY